ncbi:MAG: hypothetical protein ACXVDJ_11065, partial [Tumebacillaceae bacterium]
MSKHLHMKIRSNRVGRVLLGMLLLLVVGALLGCSSQQASTTSQAHRSKKTTSANASVALPNKGRWVTVSHVADGDT